MHIPLSLKNNSVFKILRIYGPCLLSLSLFLTMTSCETGTCRQRYKAKAEREKVRLEEEAKAKEKAEKDAAAQKTLAARGLASVVKVYKLDGSQQCHKVKVFSVDEMASELNGISIISKYKGSDGMIYAQYCGNPTGSANIYEIKVEDVPKAQERGFRILKSQ